MGKGMWKRMGKGRWKGSWDGGELKDKCSPRGRSLPEGRFQGEVRPQGIR